MFMKIKKYIKQYICYSSKPYQLNESIDIKVKMFNYNYLSMKVICKISIKIFFSLERKIHFYNKMV